MDFELGEVIAERKVLFTPDNGEPYSIVVRLGRPVPDPRAPDRTWFCPYQVLGIGRDRVLAIFGIDAMQALILALHAIPAELVAHVRAHPGQFLRFGVPDTTWLGSCRTALDYGGDLLPIDDIHREQTRHLVDVRQPAPFLRRIVRELAGGARLSLEGTFGDPSFPAEAILGHEAIGILKRNTTAPLLDFLVLRLQPDLVDDIVSQISRIGLRESIVHVQIERNGRLELAAYDNFHSDCVVTGPAITPEVLDELRGGWGHSQLPTIETFPAHIPLSRSDHARFRNTAAAQLCVEPDETLASLGLSRVNTATLA